MKGPGAFRTVFGGNTCPSCHNASGRRLPHRLSLPGTPAPCKPISLERAGPVPNPTAAAVHTTLHTENNDAAETLPDSAAFASQSVADTPPRIINNANGHLTNGGAHSRDQAAVALLSEQLGAGVSEQRGPGEASTSQPAQSPQHNTGNRMRRFVGPRSSRGQDGGKEGGRGGNARVFGRVYNGGKPGDGPGRGGFGFAQQRSEQRQTSEERRQADIVKAAAARECLDKALKELEGGAEPAIVASILCRVSIAVNTAPASARAQLVQHPVVSTACTAAQASTSALTNEALVDAIESLAELRREERFPDAPYAGVLPSLAAELVERHVDGWHLDDGSLAKLVKAARMTPTLRQAVPILLPLVCEDLVPTLEHATANSMQTLLHRFADLPHAEQPQQLMRQIVERLCCCGGLSADHLYTILAAIHNMGPKAAIDPASIKALAAKLATEVGSMHHERLTTLLQIMADLRVTDRALIQNTASAVAVQIQAMRPLEIGTALRSLARLDAHVDSRWLSRVVHYLEALPVSDYHPVTASSVTWALAKLGAKPSKAWLDQLFQEMLRRQPVTSKETPAGEGAFSAREASAMIWALAKFGQPIPSLDAFLKVAEQLLRTANSRDLASTAKGLGGLEHAANIPREILQAIERRATEIVHSFSPLGVCHVLWCFGKCRYFPERLMPAMCKHICKRLSLFNFRDLTEVVWSFAMLQFSGPAADEAISAIVRRLQHLLDADRTGTVGRGSGASAIKVRDVATLAWSMATLDGVAVERSAVLKHLAKAASRKLDWMNGMDLSNVLWACAKCEVILPDLPGLTARLEELALELSPVEISTVLWSYAKIHKSPGIEVLETLLSRFMLNMECYATQGVGNIVWACGMLRHHPGPFIKAVRHDLTRRGTQYDLHDWAGIMWAFTVLGENPGSLFQQAHHLIEEQRFVPDVKFISTVMWSVATFEAFHEPVFKYMMRRLDHFDPDMVDRESRFRINQAHLLSCLAGNTQPEDISARFRMQGNMQDWMEQLLRRELSKEAIAHYQRICETLQSAQISHIDCHRLSYVLNEHKDKALHLNVILQRPWGSDRMVAIELLSSKKLTVNTHQPLGRVLFRTACICSSGYDVLWIPFSEWEAMVAKGREEEYLINRIDGVLKGIHKEGRHVS